MKFQRRPDIDEQKRIKIVSQALFLEGEYGARSRIAEENKISRAFLYQLINRAKECLEWVFTPDSLKESKNQELLDTLILILRLEGKVSIQSIKSILEELGFSPSSVGYVSERLKAYGEILPSSLSINKKVEVLYISDEIFANSQPILITIEPESTAILKIEIASERTKEEWSGHFEELKRNNFHPLGLCSDRGIGLVEGYKQVNFGSPWYSDHFHEFRDLREVTGKLERDAYAAIKEEYYRYEVFENAKSEKNITRRITEYEEAKKISKKKMDLYDDLSTLTNLLYSSLDFFDNHGHFQTAEKVKDEVSAIFTMMEELNYSPIKEAVSSLREHLEEITKCYINAQSIYDNLLTIVPEQNILDFLCLAWHHEHKFYQTKSEAKKYHQAESNFLLNCAEGLLQEEFQEIKSFVFKELNSMVRASSLVEMVNSLIRPYLNNSKGQITQETLNLIMFYHNHHRYKSGKRKNMAPIEILTGKPLEKGWIDILLEYQKLLPKTEKSKNIESVVNEIAPDFNDDNNKITEFNVLNKFANQQSSEKRVA